jgi:peptide/nickel transport system permease protein
MTREDVMYTYILKRLVSLVPVMLILSLVIFLLMRSLLGDPSASIAGQEADQATIARVHHDLGLDRPIYVQYWRWLENACQGNLGKSFRNHLPVTKVMLERLPVTLELAFISILMAIVIAFPLGIWSALRQGSGLDRVVSGFAAFAVAMPNFWIGILLIFIFAIQLRWLPPAGYVPMSRGLAENLWLMVLPSLTLSLYYAGTLIRYVRDTMCDVLGQRYILAARGKGVPQRKVILSHALKNALIPTITVLGVETSKLFGGAVITETIFDLPGMGRLMVEAIFYRDYPVLQGTILFMAVSVLFISLIVDLMYALLDPRIKYY